MAIDLMFQIRNLVLAVRNHALSAQEPNFHGLIFEYEMLPAISRI